MRPGTRTISSTKSRSARVDARRQHGTRSLPSLITGPQRRHPDGTASGLAAKAADLAGEIGVAELEVAEGATEIGGGDQLGGGRGDHGPQQSAAGVLAGGGAGAGALAEDAGGGEGEQHRREHQRDGTQQ